MRGGEQATTSTPIEDTTDTEAQERQRELQPKVYVASLSDYNAGILHGTWLDAAQEVEELQDAITCMLQASPTDPGAEEWAIHDFEDFNGLHLGEWENLEHVSQVAKGIREHGVAYAHWATLVSEDEELDQFEERYLGHWPSLKGYAEDIFEDLGLYEEVEKCVSDNLRPYVTLDAEGFGRDLVIGGDISVIEGDGGVYVYSNR